MAQNVVLTLTADEAAVSAALRRLAALLADLTPVMRSIGQALAASTRERFETGRSPDGAAWPQSIRAKMTGGKTLVDHALLLSSIHSVARRDSVEVGTSMASRHPAVHQFGATIRAKGRKPLTFQIAGRWASKRQVTIPARPFLGLSSGDQEEVLDIVERHIARAAG